MSSIMIKLSVENDSAFMGIKTYDRLHGGRGRFLIERSALSQMLNAPKEAVHYDSDCGNYAEIRHSGDSLWFRITWLSLYSGGIVKGVQQIFSVPDRTVKSLLANGGKAKLFYAPAHPPASIETSQAAAETIRKIAQNRRLRRAFSKAMRDCFNWSGDHITLRRDGEYSFYFTTRSGFPKCGGLILHESERNGYPYVYYSVHT